MSRTSNIKRLRTEVLGTTRSGPCPNPEKLDASREEVFWSSDLKALGFSFFLNTFFHQQSQQNPPEGR